MSALSFSSLPSCLSSFFISVLSSVCLCFAKLSNFAVKTLQDTRESDLCLSSLPLHCLGFFLKEQLTLFLQEDGTNRSCSQGLLVWVVGSCWFLFRYLGLSFLHSAAGCLPYLQRKMQKKVMVPNSFANGQIEWL